MTNATTETNTMQTTTDSPTTIRFFNAAGTLIVTLRNITWAEAFKVAKRMNTRGNVHVTLGKCAEMRDESGAVAVPTKK